jgi:uncharacterized membrane protein YpjA
MNKFMLWALLWINLLGTIYGYYWYGDQLVETVRDMPLWFVPFVPDSPTASLFFTLSVAYLLYERKYGYTAKSKLGYHVRGFIEAFALITSFKYGVWAVSMIAASAELGTPMDWQDYMLSISHLGMAAEALLFTRMYRFRLLHIVLVACWSFANDYMDYGQMTFPWLPDVLRERLHSVRLFTNGLSVVSVLVALLLLPYNAAARRRTVKDSGTN